MVEVMLTRHPALSARAPNPCTAPATLNTNVATLNNPFVFNDGTPVVTAADWTCRRQQIAALILGYEGGALPGKPQSVTASFTKSGNSGSLAVTVQDNNKQIQFTPTITFPSGNPPAGGWPLVIALGGASLPIPSGVSLQISVVYNALVLILTIDCCHEF